MFYWYFWTLILRFSVGGNILYGIKISIRFAWESFSVGVSYETKIECTVNQISKLLGSLRAQLIKILRAISNFNLFYTKERKTEHSPFDVNEIKKGKNKCENNVKFAYFRNDVTKYTRNSFALFLLQMLFL